MSEKKPYSTTASINSIEGALTRLENIVASIEKTPPPLETLIERYEEGVKLLKICQEKLTAAEQRIEIITRNARGEAVLQQLHQD
ncbi:MAG: exodeoxyribonuclease VII small subunit [Chthoniobacterales bacterium]|nr:exodeoxyribonuclease VII small subunit [Chthoniobacterales bacterium]